MGFKFYGRFDLFEAHGSNRKLAVWSTYLNLPVFNFEQNSNVAVEGCS